MINFSNPTKWPLLSKCFSGTNSRGGVNNRLSFNSTINKEASSNRDYRKSRDYFEITIDHFPGSREYEPFIHNGELEIVSFHDEVRTSKLEKDADSPKLIGGFGRPKDPEEKNHVACGEGYLAVHSRHDSFVHIYTSEKKKYRTSYEVAGKIAQLDIIGKCLYVSAQERSDMFHLHSFDLRDLDNKDPISTQILSPPMCFGKKHSLHMRNVVQSQVYAQEINGRDGPFKIEPASKGTHLHYFFSNGDHFIKVANKCDVFEFEKVDLKKEKVQRSMIDTNIKFSDNDIDIVFRSNVYFQDDRLIFTRSGLNNTRVLAYDLKSKKQTDLFHTENAYRSDLLTAANKIYYLMCQAKGSEPVFKLTTLEFGRE